MTIRELDDCDTATTVLSFVRDRHRIAAQAEADQLAAAVAWAGIHAIDDPNRAAGYRPPGFEGEMAIAGPGAPLVAEFCVMELAAALGMSSDAGRDYLGHAVELAHRLPRLYARTQTCELPVWKARRVAAATLDLPAAGAAHVDRHLAPVAHRVSLAQLDRTVEEARLRYDPDEAEARRLAAAEARHFTIETRQVSFDGHVDVHGALDLADALDLEDAVARRARDLGALGLDASLDVRRSIAVGDLARRQLALDLNTPDVEPGTGPVKGQRKPRQVVLHVHLADAALDTGIESGIARVEETRSMVSVEQVRSWCTNADTQVVIKPVLDLAGHVHVDAYEVPDRLRERQTLLQHTCVYPWCQRPARRCDSDHITPAAQGGPTCDCNTAPLCRRHHRTKTHTRWRYEKTGPTTFIWQSPHGLTLRRDHRGTTDLTDRPQP